MVDLTADMMVELLVVAMVATKVVSTVDLSAAKMGLSTVVNLVALMVVETAAKKVD